MKVTLNWLKQYVEITASPSEVAEQLTMLGIEVEGVQVISGEFEGVVVAHILDFGKHPNADKLSVCRVHDGKSERQIVCGATNFKTGDKVPLALPGCTLPTPPGSPPFTIKVSKMRGVESQGMLCSPSELGLADDADGLLILAPEAVAGQPLAQHLGRSGGDVVYDLEITPNRPDLNSVIGLARELAALASRPLRLPSVQLTNTSSEPIEQWVRLQVEDSDLCPRYNARIVRGLKVGPSPDWLVQMLGKIGVRTINNIVDITNYVLMETGQPLHAFDYHLLHKPAGGGPSALVVRPARDQEEFMTLDGQKRTLSSKMLLIADDAKGIALAGIMGGQNSEIRPETVDVLIESAAFKQQNIRATSRQLGLKTDASYRFERGCDVGICDWASRRAAQLMAEIAGGVVLETHLDTLTQPPAPVVVTLDPARTDRLLGISIPRAEQAQLLARLGLEIVPDSSPGPSPIAVKIPSFRIDLKSEIDLIEEITRLYGVERIPSTAPRGAFGSNSFEESFNQFAEVRRILTALGLNESQGQTLVPESSATLVSGPDNLVRLANPLSSDMDVLRPALLPGLLDHLRHNLHHKTPDIALFEIGRVFSLANGKVGEEWRLACALTGQRLPNHWSGADRDAKLDIYDLKGVLEDFFEQLGVRGLMFHKQAASGGIFVESAEIQLGKQSLGQFGQLSPVLARRYDLKDAVLLAELKLNLLLSRRQTQKSFKPLPQFPAIRRDVAMILPEPVTHEQILACVKAAKAPNLEAVELFDVFRGKNVPPGQKSVAYAFTYRNPERTLTDAEVNMAHQKVTGQFKQSLQATIRES